MKRRLAMLFGPLAAGAALAQIAQEEDSALAEIVITAQFREEKLQETPLSLSVLDSTTIERHNIQRLPDVATSIPNAILDNGDAGSGKSALAFIRGIGQADFNYTVEPGVGIYIDDVYHSTLFGTAFDLLDLQHIEVLRGPQGTLFGKNSIGGALRLISQKPRGDGSGRLELTAGNFDRREVRGMFDVPLVGSSLLLRMAASFRERRGHVEQLDFACVHPDLGGVANPNAPFLSVFVTQRPPTGDCKLGTFGDEHVKAARASLRWVPNDELDVNFVADWTDDDSRAGAQTLIALNTNPLDPRNPQTGPFGGFNGNVAIPIYGIPYDERFMTGSFYSTFANLRNLVHVGPSQVFPGAAVTGITSSPNADTLEAYGLSTTVDWDLTPAIQIKSITAYRAYSGVFSDDVDSSPINQTLQTNVLDHHQFSQEIRMRGTALTARLDWTTGLFYFDGYSLNRGPVDLSAVSWLVPNLDFTQHDSSNVTNSSVFADATWHVTKRLNLTAGARHTEENKDYTFRHISFVPDVPSLVPPTRTEVRYSRNNPRVAVDYRWTPALMTYVSFATGFRAGGFNGRPFNTSQVTAFGPETLQSYEIGLKSEWLERRVRINIAAFLGNYEDVQLPILTIDGMGQPFFAPVNVGRARITGGEIELAARPTPRLNLSASFGLNEYESTELGSAINCADVANPIPAPAPGSNCTIDGLSLGKPLPAIPKRTASASIQYLAHLASAGSISSSLHLSYRSASFGDAIASPAATVPSRVLLDGRIAWQPAASNWEVALSGTNLTNEQYYINKRNLSGLWGMVLGQPGRPREWALSVTRTFESSPP